MAKLEISQIRDSNLTAIQPPTSSLPVKSNVNSGTNKKLTKAPEQAAKIRTAKVILKSVAETGWGRGGKTAFLDIQNWGTAS